MEPDRFKHNQMSYIVGLCCLYISLGLFVFSLYLLPYLFFDWHYNVPDFIENYSAILQYKYEVSASGVAWVMCLGLVFPAVLLFIVADVLSNKIDRKIYGIKAEKKPKIEPAVEGHVDAESKGLVLKIVILIVVIFIVAQFFHWVISSPA